MAGMERSRSGVNEAQMKLITVGFQVTYVSSTLAPMEAFRMVALHEIAEGIVAAVSPGMHSEHVAHVACAIVSPEVGLPRHARNRR